MALGSEVSGEAGLQTPFLASRPVRACALEQLSSRLCATNINYLLTTLQAVIRLCCWQLFPKPTRGSTGWKELPVSGGVERTL